VSLLATIKLRLNFDSWPISLRLKCHQSWVLIQDLQRCDLPRQASAMAYTTLFSLIPSLAVLFTVIGLFLPLLGDQAGLFENLKGFLIRNLATGSGTQVVDQIQSFLSSLDLKKIGMSMFVGLLVTLILLLQQIEVALNRIWNVAKARPIITRFVYFWLFLTLGVFGIAVMFGFFARYGVTALLAKTSMAVVDRVDNLAFLKLVANWLAWCSVFFLVYKVVPNCFVSHKAALRGALLAGTAFYLLSKFYTTYVSSIVVYKSIYGTLAALPIFLLWMYFCWIVVLGGALFAWRIQKGFPPMDQDHLMEESSNRLDQIRNHAIRYRMPLLVLTSIYQEFETGKAKGISTNRIVSALHLPEVWIQEAIESLYELNMIAKVTISNDDNNYDNSDDKSDEELWLPTTPASKLDLNLVQNQINKSFEKWMTHWDSLVPHHVLKMFENNQLALEQTTMAQLLLVQRRSNSAT
jgi:membrane protein